MTQQWPPAGWYQDPNNASQNRYWDGAAWTEHVSPSAPTPMAATPPIPPAPASQWSGSVLPPTATAMQRSSGGGNWFASHKILTGLGVLVILIVIGAIASGGGSDGSTNNDSAVAASTQQPTTDGSPASAPSTAPAVQPTSRVVFSKSGSGQGQTKEFTVGDEWAIHYSYNCNSFGEEGNFAVDVLGTNNDPSLSNEGTNQLGLKGADTVYNHHGGTYYLSINSECNWKIRVTSG